MFRFTCDPFQCLYRYIYNELQRCLWTGRRSTQSCPLQGPRLQLLHISSHFHNRLSHVQEDYEARKELWEAIDVNGNGFLSLAEVTKVLMSSWSS